MSQQNDSIAVHERRKKNDQWNDIHCTRFVRLVIDLKLRLQPLDVAASMARKIRPVAAFKSVWLLLSSTLLNI